MDGKLPGRPIRGLVHRVSRVVVKHVLRSARLSAQQDEETREDGKGCVVGRGKIMAELCRVAMAEEGIFAFFRLFGVQSHSRPLVPSRSKGTGHLPRRTEPLLVLACCDAKQAWFRWLRWRSGLECVKGAMINNPGSVRQTKQRLLLLLLQQLLCMASSAKCVRKMGGSEDDTASANRDGAGPRAELARATTVEVGDAECCRQMPICSTGQASVESCAARPETRTAARERRVNWELGIRCGSTTAAQDETHARRPSLDTLSSLAFVTPCSVHAR